MRDILWLIIPAAFGSAMTTIIHDILTKKQIEAAKKSCMKIYWANKDPEMARHVHQLMKDLKICS